MKWFTECCGKDVNTEGILVSKVAQQIKAALNRAQRYSLLKSNDFVYEVFSPETIRIDIVRLDTKTCTCFEWQLSCLPYSHALAVNLELQQDSQGYAKEFYHFDAYYEHTKMQIFLPILILHKLDCKFPSLGFKMTTMVFIYLPLTLLLSTNSLGDPRIRGLEVPPELAFGRFVPVLTPGPIPNRK